MSVMRGEGRPSAYFKRDGKTKVPSVTSVLGRCKQAEALMWWYYGIGKTYGKPGHQQPNEIMRDAAVVGSVVHDMFEQSFYDEDPLECLERIRNHFKDEDDCKQAEKQAQRCFASLRTWVDKVKPQVIATEVPLVSEEYGFAGTPDLVCAINHELVIVDVKTSSGTYPDHMRQMAAYAQLWRENYGEEIKNHIVLHVPRKTGVLTIHEQRDVIEAWEYFWAALQLYEADRISKEEYAAREEYSVDDIKVRAA